MHEQQSGDANKSSSHTQITFLTGSQWKCYIKWFWKPNMLIYISLRWWPFIKPLFRGWPKRALFLRLAHEQTFNLGDISKSHGAGEWHKRRCAWVGWISGKLAGQASIMQVGNLGFGHWTMEFVLINLAGINRNKHRQDSMTLSKLTRTHKVIGRYFWIKKRKKKEKEIANLG